MSTLKVGDKAPAIKARDQNGNEITLAQFKGKKVVLYFYPKDSTPGCTKEACSFRDNHKVLTKKGYVVIGVSNDSEKSHVKFIEKYELPFPLIADTDHKVVEDYGVWGLKKFMGREFEGIRRISYLINPKGQIAKAYEKVNPLTHASEIIEDLNKLKSSK